ncbi:MAG: hypothetical protein JSS26_08405 [Nitrospira sp.]|nr:hypothetical protein [Nitrospira sp.]
MSQNREVPMIVLTEFRKAGERILAQRGVYGGARHAALVWLLTFAQENPTEYSTGEGANRWEELKRFAFDAGLGPDEPPISNQISVRWPGDKRARFGEEPPLSTPAEAVHSPFYPGMQRELAKFQMELRDYLERYVKSGGVSINGLTLDLHVTNSTEGVLVSSWLHPCFFYQAFHLLGELGPRIRKCEGCARLFLAGRSDKKWCSGLCQAKTYKRMNPAKQHEASPTNKKGGGMVNIKRRAYGKKTRT